ncbi:iron donor protein CyaY [Sulfuricella sp.]|uniref:iron donor protein CyaY n=1 Tax=Sulfuricella sp. TaxID=2099377 RepID=UPI002C6C0CB9|nr:iron donor protein CyaY [Sulfuricella sp.]HUX64958.1 iron donor protein CyaY [Sulfuricella sp.]
MTESEFNKLADETLARIEQSLDDSDTDIDYEMKGGVLELSFENGSKIIVNRQTATREIWVAAKSGGYHFLWKDGGWHDTRDGGELFAALGRYASEQAGVPVSF